MARFLFTVVLTGIAVLAACSAPRRASLGGECEVNSDCDAPLVCRIGFCRNECATSADCTTGLSCVLDENHLGVCQLSEEASCTLASECQAPLVCRFNECTNPCNDDRDCLGGARCRIDPTGNACIDPSSTSCAFDGECASDEFCFSGRCRQQCFTDRDCRRGWVCNTVDFAGKCEDPTVDAGPRDTGGADAGPTDTAPSIDSGMPPTTCAGAPLVGVVSLDVGDTHSCAIVGGASPGVVCWGTVETTSLLFGGAASQPCAARVAALDGLPQATAIAVVDSSACVLRAGRVECWGWDQYGELGNGTGMSPSATPTPVTGLPPTGLTGVGGGSFDTFFAWTPTASYGWGRSDNGSVGDGTMGLRLVETAIPTTSWTGTVLTIEQGGQNSCALTDIGGTLTQRCVGSGFVFGDMGGPSIANAVDIAVGGEYGCALTATDLQCWGSGFFGELGDGMLHERATAAPVLGLPSVPVEVDAGSAHACARFSDGEVWCWGRTAGYDPTVFPAASISVPQPVFGDAAEVRCGYEHTCIRTTSGGVQCIGLDAGALGHPSTTVPLVAVDVYLEP